MAKKKGVKKALTPNSGYKFSTLREESSGKKAVTRNVSSILRMEHLQKLAIWAGAEASVPPLGALLGRHLAATGDAIGVPLDSSLFPCQRCETILHPGQNCTVRIKKNAVKTKGSKKSGLASKNNVVYSCHFCSDQNIRRGTPKGHMREILASRSKSISDLKSNSNVDERSVGPSKISATESEIINMNHNPNLQSSPGKGNDERVRNIPIENNPATPSEKVAIGLSEKKRKRKRKSKSGLKKLTENEDSAQMLETTKPSVGSNKRKRKSWSSLKEIAESSEHENARGFSNLKVPFFI